MKEYMIVKVQFNVSSKTCTGKLYTFLAYEEYTPGDVVVVDTQNGFQLARWNSHGWFERDRLQGRFHRMERTPGAGKAHERTSVHDEQQG